MLENISEEMKKEYPFQSHFFKTADDYLIHYLDEGKTTTFETNKPFILLLHGNPTWSFYYRNVIKKLSPHYRVICPDHIGMGLSEKPQIQSQKQTQIKENNSTNDLYSLNWHIKNIESLLLFLKLNQQPLILIVHDWGGAIGMGLAVERIKLIKGIVFLNTAAFRSVRIPKRIFIGKCPYLGTFLIQHCNAFAQCATLMATTKGLSPVVKKGLLYPYQKGKDARVAINAFVKDIPLSKKHPSYNRLYDIEKKLTQLKAPKLFLWGMKDFCFDPQFLSEWLRIFQDDPNKEIKTYANGGHYILEDEKDDVVKEIDRFLKRII